MKINRNIFFAERFWESLYRWGVRDVVISPGSRSTSLVFACLHNSKLNAISILDERSAAFFATGLARIAKRPVAILCTSGTAAAEYYPGIIEAYQQRIPLIICTADRPERLRNSGANQTIDQFNLYHNHIRYFAEFQVAKPTKAFYNLAAKSINEGMEIALRHNTGPVHFNIAMDKPFEPDVFTDDIIASELSKPGMWQKQVTAKKGIRDTSKTDLVTAKKMWEKAKFPIVLVGPGEFSTKFVSRLSKFARTSNVPVIIDVCSGIRFGRGKIANALCNYDVYFKKVMNDNLFKPDLVILFGRYPTSGKVDEFITKSKASKIIVNPFGDRFDPTSLSRIIVAAEPEAIFEAFGNKHGSSAVQTRGPEELYRLEKKVQELKLPVLSHKNLTELSTIHHLLHTIPAHSNLFVSNSLAVRDLDRIASMIGKALRIFHNRGASGIDGILSSALGVAYKGKSPTFLLVGDLAFYYDMTALQIAHAQKSKLKIVLVNNNGGRIFDHLPSSRFRAESEQFFITPQQIDTKKIVEAFGGDYYKAITVRQFTEQFAKLNQSDNFGLLEVFIDNNASDSERKALAAII